MFMPQGSTFVPHLMYAYAVVALLLLGVCRLCARGMPGMRGIGPLSWSYGLTLAAVMSQVGIWLVAPLWLTVLVANGAMFWSWLLIYWAAADILDRRMRFFLWGVGTQHLALIALGYYTYVKPDATVRTEIVCMEGALLAMVTAFLFFSYEEPESGTEVEADLRLPAQMMGWLLLIVSVQHIAHAMLVIMLYRSSDFVHLDQIQSAFTYVGMILAAATGCGLIWLAVRMQRRQVYGLLRTNDLTTD
jgi:hypothetical protein